MQLFLHVWSKCKPTIISVEQTWYKEPYDLEHISNFIGMQKSYQDHIMGMAVERYILVIWIVMEQNMI